MPPLRSNHGLAGPDWVAVEGVVRRWLVAHAPTGQVDDLAQEALLRIHRTMPSDVRSVDAWAITAARSVLADALRSAARRADLPVDPATLAGVEDGIVDGPGDAQGSAFAQPERALDVAAARDADAAIVRCVGKRVEALPAPQRDALVAVTTGGRTQAQAAADAGVSIPGMKSRVQRGARAVRTAAESCCRFELDGRGRPIGMTPRQGTVCTCGCAEA